MERTLNNLVAFLADYPIVRQINVFGGMGGVYEQEETENTDESQ